MLFSSLFILHYLSLNPATLLAFQRSRLPLSCFIFACHVHFIHTKSLYYLLSDIFRVIFYDLASFLTVVRCFKRENSLSNMICMTFSFDLWVLVSILFCNDHRNRKAFFIRLKAISKNCLNFPVLYLAWHNFCSIIALK